MAVELCSENPGVVMSPARISFSYDLSQADAVPADYQLFRSSPSSSGDFDFCTQGTHNQASASADELFADGKIIPAQIKSNVVPPKQIQPTELPSPSPDLPSCGKDEIDERLKETKGTISESEEKHGSKSFWRFKRSSSLNCGSTAGYAPSLCPLPLLSRSNSTGSSSSSQKQNSKKIPPVAASKLNSSSSSGSHQKPPLKKSYGHGSYGNGVRINPVLNVPSGNLFGLGSIFFNGKEKSKRK